MGQERVDRLKQDYDVEVTWEPFLLRWDVPEGGTPTPMDIQEKRKRFGARVQQMAAEAGLPMLDPDWMPNTRRPLTATEWAKDQGKGDAFHKIVFRKYYAEGLNIETWDVLRDAAVEAGLDPEAMQQATESPEYKKTLEDKFRFAYEVGVTGVPLYVFDDVYGVSGAQPYEVFRRFMDQYLSGELRAE